MARSARIGVGVLFAVNTFTSPVDFWAHREMFGVFLGVRIVLNLVLALIYFRLADRWPVGSVLLGCFSGGLMLLTVIFGTGGPTSDYYAGLLLMLVGIPVLVPLPAAPIGIINAALIAGFAFPAAYMLEPGEGTQFAMHCFFLVAAGGTSVASAALLDRMRFSDFCQRRAVEKARDELQRLDEQKSRFTANVHHELRTPLTLTLAPLEAMLGGEFGEVAELQRGYLKTMHTNALRLLKLINNLLDLAKIEGQQMTIRRRRIEVARKFDEIVEGARPLAEQKGVELIVVGVDGGPWVHADPDAIEKVAVNLLGNALKFTESGGTIRVDARSEQDGIRVSVTDTGVGIPKEELGRIFDRFAQVDGSATRRYEGTGIGLALVKELVSLHGGRIWAESEGIGHGSAIHVFLPQGEPDGPEDEEVLETSSGEAVPLRQSLAGMESELTADLDEPPEMRLVEMQRHLERQESRRDGVPDSDIRVEAPDGAPEVLIAEDNADMRRLIGFLLGREFRVRVTRNGREALESIRTDPPDLVLTDVMMPEMTGIELCRELKGDPATAAIPVVLVTSKAEREMKIEGLELGADDYVAKPFHPRELLARVRSLVRLHGLQEEVAERNAALEAANLDLERTLAELKDTEVRLVQAERLSAVGELAAGVAHEVNNPINFASNAILALRTHVDDLRQVATMAAELDWRDRDKLSTQLEEFERLRNELGVEELESSLGELTAIVAEGLDRTSRLVGDLRDFAAPGQPSQVDVDLGRGIRSTLALLGHETRRAGIQVEVQVPEGLPRVHGDPRALNQVLLNLLKNATEALEGRGGTISVLARAERGGVVVAVSDDGPGIDPAVRDRLFEPFFSTKEAGRGTGLGLSISRRIVLDHGGRLEVHSESTRGTTFEMWLPAEGGEGGA